MRVIVVAPDRFQRRVGVLDGQVQHCLDPAVAAEDGAREPLVVGHDQGGCDSGIRMHAQIEHRLRKHYLVVQAQRLDGPLGHGVRVFGAFGHRLAALGRVRNAAAHLLEPQTRNMGGQGVVPCAGKGGGDTLAVVAQHLVVDVVEYVAPLQRFLMMRVDIDDQPVTQAEPVDIAGSVGQDVAGVGAESKLLHGIDARVKTFGCHCHNAPFRPLCRPDCDSHSARSNVLRFCARIRAAMRITALVADRPSGAMPISRPAARQAPAYR